MIHVVLGMHKSGTTLISQLLHESGINMGSFDEDQSYDDGNKYERESTLMLNENLLGAEGKNSIFISHQSTPDITADQEKQMHTIINNANEKYTDWGFKDPRTCLTYPLWEKILPEHKVIAIFRSPHESWNRYKIKTFYKQIRTPVRAYTYLSAWSQHNYNILQFLSKTDKDYLILEYSALMSSNEEFARLVSFVKRPLNDTRNPDLYRNRNDQYKVLDLVDHMIKMKLGKSSQEIFSTLQELRNQQIQTEQALTQKPMTQLN